jgi:hypothetical protein
MNLQQHERSDGLRELEVVRGFRHASVVTRAPDGSRRMHCLTQENEAVRLLKLESE